MTASSERKLVWLCAACAVVRVAFFALSFPFFGHIDEVAHVDTVFKWARGQLPAIGADAYEARTIELFAFSSSPEYLKAPGPHGVDPMPMQFRIPRDWTSEQRRAHLDAVLAQFGGAPNHNAFEPPVYYALAGPWLRIGERLGLSGLEALLWLRMLGALALGATVLLGAAVARHIAPKRPLIRVGVPLLIAVWPQDVFYFVNNDVLAPPAFAAAALLLLRVRAGRAGAIGGAIAGLAVAISFLVKPTHVTLVAAAATLLLWPPRARRHLGAVAAGAALPVLAWQLWFWAATGDLSPSAHKTRTLGCGPQSWEGVLAHPIWSLDGAWTFLEGVGTSTWRGETQWHGEVMRIPGLDVALLALTVACGLASLAASLRARATDRLPPAFAAAAWVGAGTGIAMLVALSVGIEFGPNTYPSRAFPFLISGRLLCGLFPLLAIPLIDGLERFTRPLGAHAKWIALAVVTATLLAYELIVTVPVVASPHNFWNLDA